MTILTVGHSNRTLDEFLALLHAHEIARVVDVRTSPRSRFNPHFNRNALQDALEKVGIAHTHMPTLGGLRQPQPDSINTAWEDERFRAYADYMQTPEFAEALAELVAIAESDRIVVMCAEADPERCHRSLIADALTVRGVDALHILDAATTQPHKLTSFARVADGVLSYPGGPTLFGG